MKICNLKLHSIATADPPLRSSYGLHAPWALRTIVELETDDGIKGVSETYGGDGPRAALEAARERVIGRDPFQLAGLYREICGTGQPQREVPGGRSCHHADARDVRRDRQLRGRAGRARTVAEGQPGVHTDNSWMHTQMWILRYRNRGYRAGRVSRTSRLAKPPDHLRQQSTGRKP